jgi:hypothetical protein
MTNTDLQSYAQEIQEVAEEFLLDRASLQHWQLDYLLEITLTEDDQHARIIELWDASQLTY